MAFAAGRKDGMFARDLFRLSSAFALLWIAFLFPLVCRGDNEKIIVQNDEQQNSFFKQGGNLLMPNIELVGQNPPRDENARKQILQGIAYLDAVTTYNPKNWTAFWFKGKGYQALGDHKTSYREFKAAYVLQQTNPDVSRELAYACMQLGMGDEAIEVSLHAVTANPNNAGLYANLGLAYLIAGKNDSAKYAIEKSLKMDPRDKISQAALAMVQDVIDGRRPQPKKYSDLEK